MNLHRVFVGSCVVAASAMLGVAPSAQAVSIPDAHPTYIDFGDLTTFNFRILDQDIPEDNGLPPATPTGNNVPFVRMFTNGNKSNDGKTDIDAQDSSPTQADTYNLQRSASNWYGIEFTAQGQNPLVATDLLLASQVLTFIQSLNPGSVTPLFAFDQNQTGSEGGLDIFIDGRLILVDPTVVGSLSGLTAAQINAIVDPAVTSGVGATVFNFFDSPNFFDDDGDMDTTDDPFVLLPGLFNPDPMNYTTVNNNGAGNNADWGGFISSLDLNDYLNHYFFVELRFKLDNNGFEEAYILGGTGSVVPTPGAAGIGLIGFGLLGLIRRPRQV